MFYEELKDTLEKERQKTKELESRVDDLIELVGECNIVIWKYSRGDEPNGKTFKKIQKLKNKLGIGNGVLKRD